MNFAYWVIRVFFVVVGSSDKDWTISCPTIFHMSFAAKLTIIVEQSGSFISEVFKYKESIILATVEKFLSSPIGGKPNDHRAWFGTTALFPILWDRSMSVGPRAMPIVLAWLRIDWVVSYLRYSGVVRSISPRVLPLIIQFCLQTLCLLGFIRVNRELLFEEPRWYDYLFSNSIVKSAV